MKIITSKLLFCNVQTKDKPMAKKLCFMHVWDCYDCYSYWKPQVYFPISFSCLSLELDKIQNSNFSFVSKYEKNVEKSLAFNVTLWCYFKAQF